MKQFAHSSVEKLEGTHPEISYVPVVAEPDFSELRAFAKENGIYNTPYDSGPSFSIRVPPDSPLLDRWFERLEKVGWTVTHRWVPIGQRRTKFGYTISRIYEPTDLDTAGLLYLTNWPHLTDFADRDGERWIGDVAYVGADTGQGWKQQIGTIGHQSSFVSAKVKREMIEAGIDGLKFHPLRWNRHNEAKGEFWELDSDFRMPSCLLPVVNMDGPLAYEEDRPYSPVELQFRRAEVQAMGSFDVAWTREDVGDLRRQDWGRHWLVVTQKFRQFLKRIDFPMTYGIVRLLE